MFAGVSIEEKYLNSNRNQTIARAIYSLLQDLNVNKLLVRPVSDFKVVSKNNIVYFEFEFNKGKGD